ncbi:MAG: cyclic nucleotide-binding domain-containing protein [Gammaproteobacteria bacterium]|nr:cyclic nucleotide-binding domain-containing protein [Gammaproteobacteria bacterium]
MSDNPAQPQLVDAETLQGLEPIGSLSAPRIRELAAKTPVESIGPGVCLFAEGDRDRKLLYLLSGEIELRSRTNAQVQRITAGMRETWLPIDNKQPHQWTATTKSDVEVIRIDMEQFDQMLTWDQMATAEASPKTKTVIKGEGDWRTKLRSTLAFNNIPAANIEKVFERMESLDVTVGDVVIRQGDPGDYFYLIDKGSAKVTRQMMGKGKPVELAEIGAGVAFGEEALISDKPRNANVVMISEGRLMRLAKKDFIALLKEPLLESIDLHTALDKLSDDAVFLDVRVPSEFKESRLPNAVNIPLNELRQRIGELNANTYYVCYCSTGRRSSAAAFLLSNQGLKSSVLKNGLQDVPSSLLIK